MQLYSFMSVSERKEASEMFQIRFETITIKYIKDITIRYGMQAKPTAI